MNEPWISVEQIAEHLGVTRDSIYRWTDAKGLPAHKIGRHWKFKVSEVDDWVRRGETRDDDAGKTDVRYPTSMSGGELRAAVKAMRFVNQSAKFGQNAINIAEKLMSKNGAAVEELVLAAGYLRVAFTGRLRGLANGRSLGLPFSMESHKIKPADLWSAMTTVWPPQASPLGSGNKR